jgi:hypothetical protein
METVLPFHTGVKTGVVKLIYAENRGVMERIYAHHVMIPNVTPISGLQKRGTNGRLVSWH